MELTKQPGKQQEQAPARIGASQAKTGSRETLV